MEEDFPDEYKKTQFSLWILLEWLSLILIIGALVTTLSVPFLREKNLWQLLLWKWEKAVQNCVWLGLVLIAWHFLFDERVQRETKSDFLQYVTKVLDEQIHWMNKYLIPLLMMSMPHKSEVKMRLKQLLIKKIFQNVARRGCRFIHPEDLMRFMREDEAIKTISLFEGALDTGRISKSALKNWVVNAFRERRALALTLNDTKTAVNKLHRMLNFLVAIIILVIWLLILEIATSKFLLFVSSQLVLVAFIFGNTCKTVFEAIIFLFVMHPFDVGDRCQIDATQMVVEEMNILTTVFLRFDNQKITIPNAVLATKAIHNFYRSPDMGDSVEFLIHVATPAEKISLIKHRINSFVDNKKEHWYPSPFIVLKDHEQLDMVRMAIWPTQRMNFQDMGERFIRRSLLVGELMKIFKDLDIQYRLMPLDINVRAMPTTSDRLPPSWTAFTN
ncbi:mechanosensitive ion channel protein [Trifolium repens]|nr:mechanosensitive ion channel protein [Trifolium repens]